MTATIWTKMKILIAIVSVVSVLGLAPKVSGQRNRTSRTAARTQDQTKPAQPPDQLPVLPDIRNDPDVQAADIAIIANITAKELRFDVVPNPTVEFRDKAKNQTIWQAERFNLPDKVEPGVTYRNIGIRLKIVSRLADIERIVAEALGEVPISETEIPQAPRPNETPRVESGPSQPDTPRPNNNQKSKP